MARFGDFDQYLDNAGDPLADGKLYFYESGTTTPKLTYADINNSIPNTNPVLLSAAGRQPNIFFDGVAKVILTDKNDVQIAVRDPAGETSTDFGDAWVATKIYSALDVVLGSDGVYYRSLINGNQNNNPVTTSGSWTLLYSVEWNAGITYSVGDVVTYGSQQYQSLQDSNLNQNPSTQAAYWVGLSFAWLATTTYATGMNAVGTDGVLYTSLQDSNTGNDPATSPAYWVGTSAAAAASATAAAASAAAALVSENAAELAETNAETAQAAAEAAQAAAETAEVNAETAETNSAASAASSATSASESAASAAAALVSQNAAATSESNSASSATASASSASAALDSETASAASEAAAATSESNAAASASSSASSASASASSASDSATSASASASSATDSANSATAAAGSATAAAGSATAAAASATAAETAETGVEAAVEEFEGLYLGAKSTPPTTDNQGNPLQTGALYFNTVSDTMFVWSGSSWAAAGSAVNGTAERQEYVATSGQTNFAATYDVGFVDVYLNGSKLIPTTDFTATDGATIILGTGATAGDNVSIIAYGAFNVADVYTQAQSDARYTQQSNNLSDLDNAATALTNLGLTATATELNYVDGVTSNIQTQIDNIDALPSQTGNAGNFLTTDGTDASWAEVSASPTLEATASGSLANGDLVSINPDGTVSVVTENTQSFGTAVEFTSNQLEYIDIVYDANANKVVIAYRDLSVGNYGFAIVGTVSGSTISFGTAVAFSAAGQAAWISLVYSSAANKIVVCYQTPNASNHGKARVGTISGTSISFGTEATFRAAESAYITSIYHPVEDRIVIGYRDGALSDKGYLVAGTISGTDISFASAQDFEAGHTQDISLTYDSAEENILVAYRDVGNSNYGKVVVADLNDTYFTFGTIVLFRSGDTQQIDSTYDSINGKHIVAYRSASQSNRGKCNIFTVSGTTVTTPNTQEEFSTSTYADQITVTFDEDTGLIGFVFRHGAASNRYVTATYVAGDTLSFSSEATWGTHNGVFCHTANIGSSKFVTAYRDNNNTPTLNNDGYAIVFNNTNSNASKFIGISDAAYSDAATAKVQIVGSVDDAQSGLSAGTKYYVTDTGTLSTTENSVYAGIAVSATKLIVKG